MKVITITALLAALVAIPLLIKYKTTKLQPSFRDENKRYDIDDYISTVDL